MDELITDYCVFITQYGCLLIYAICLSIGVLWVINATSEILIKRIIGQYEFIKGFQYYLKMKKERNHDQ